MKRLDYHLTLQNDGTVQAELHDAEKVVPSGTASLNLSHLTVITKDYLPFLETTAEQTYDRLKRLGTLLYELIFTPPVRGHFEELAWRKIAERPDEYRLTLSLIMQKGLRSEVAALPWELLYCPRSYSFLAADPRISFSRRYLDWASIYTKRLAPYERLRILLVRLQPRGVAPVALLPISNFLNDLTALHTNIIKPFVLENPEPLQIEEALRHYRPHIVHMLMHGRFHDRGTHFALVDASGGDVRWYGDGSLADLFNVHRPLLVILQGCDGGRSSDLLSFSNGGAWLVQNQIPAVIAMQYPIMNKVGWKFAQAFYRHLVAGDDLDAAVQRARRTLAKADTTSQAQDDYSNRDFAAPVLWLRPEIRQLFQPLETEEKYDTGTLVHLTISTPSGDDYEADVPSDTLIDQLMRTFLHQWQQPRADPPRSQRYSFRIKDGVESTLDRSYTLRDVGLTTKAEFELVAEPIGPEVPIRLTIENDQGELYNTVVLLNTPVSKLAQEFLKDKPGTGEIVVEQTSDPSATEAQPLRLEESLYAQSVNDSASLRIYRASTPLKE